MAVKISENRVFIAGGKTQARLSTDGSHLFTLNKNALVKVLNLTDLESEPDIIDVCPDPSTFEVSELDPEVIYVVSRNGDLHRYNIKENKSRLCFRSSLPLRDLCLIHDEKVCVVGGDDLELTLVALEEGESNKKLVLDDQLVSLSYNKRNNILAVSLSNGNVVFYSLSSTLPNKIHTVTGVISKVFYNDDEASSSTQTDSLAVDGLDPMLCDDNRTSTKVVWSNKGDSYAIPTKDGDINLYNLSDHALITSFRPSVAVNNWDAIIIDQLNSDTICAVGNSKEVSHLFVWKLSNGLQTLHDTCRYSITSLSWRSNEEKTALSLIAGTWSGDVITFNDIVASEKPSEKKNSSRTLFMESDDDALLNDSDIDASARDIRTDLDADSLQDSRPRRVSEHKGINEKDEESEDINSDNLFTDAEDDPANVKRSYNFENEDDFIEDDNGEAALYKKPKTYVPQIPTLQKSHSRRARQQPTPQFQYRPFSSGATPFGNSDKRYLTINAIGHVWTTRNEGGSNSITVSFFDVSRFREYHFDDLFQYDLCSLTEEGVLLGQSKRGLVFYRSHNQSGESWTKTIPLIQRERITSIASTPQRVVIGTSFGYLRTFNEFGLALSVEKTSPIVALAAFKFKVLTVHYSQYHGISYSLFQQHPQTGNKYYQRECPLPIALPQPNGGSRNDDDSDDEFLKYDDIFNDFNPLGIKALFFSSFGDPCLFGHDNVLLVLSKWRKASEARWVPFMDTNLELWKMSNGKRAQDIHIWPLGLNFDSFTYLLLKGRNCWPDIPMTVPTEMEVRMPVISKHDFQKKKDNEENSRDAIEETEAEVEAPLYLTAEEEFVRTNVLGDLLKDMMDNEGEIYGFESDLMSHVVATHDKSLLRLLAYVCSEQDVQKAVSIVHELKQDKALSAARKIAERAELQVLVRKINAIIEARFEADANNL